MERAGKSAMTIGVFDGIHRGHQKLLETIVRRGSAYIPVVITFTGNPKKLLRAQDTWEGDILSLNRKIALFEDLGIAMTVLIDFSSNFSKLSGSEFLRLLRLHGNMGFLAVGSNFRCGYRLDTDVSRIKAIHDGEGIVTEIVEPVLRGSLPISSSRIRQAIAGGDLPAATDMLGRNVEVDLSGIGGLPRGEGCFFDTASRRRIRPPPGRYPVLLFRTGQGATETEIAVERGGVFIPVPVNAEFPVERIEFVTERR
jgi:riboflavin kinase/FMN adenylyltransferase